MPIYEYRRPDGTTFEIQQSFSDDTLTHDPETGVPVQQVFHSPAVHFKGSGFYNTDYGTKKRQRETAAAAESSKADKSKSDGSSGSDAPSSTNSSSKAESKSSDSSGSKSEGSGSKSEGAKKVEPAGKK